MWKGIFSSGCGLAGEGHESTSAGRGYASTGSLRTACCLWTRAGVCVCMYSLMRARIMVCVVATLSDWYRARVLMRGISAQSEARTTSEADRGLRTRWRGAWGRICGHRRRGWRDGGALSRCTCASGASMLTNRKVGIMMTASMAGLAGFVAGCQ